MMVLKSTEFNRTKVNNNKAKHQQNSKKELKEMLFISRHRCARRVKLNLEALIISGVIIPKASCK
jgi:hypothetical protein